MNIAIIPARSGSQRIKNKNIKLFSKKPIIYWTIKILKESNLFEAIAVSSDSNKILEYSKKYGSDILIKDQKGYLIAKQQHIQQLNMLLNF